MKVQSSKFKVQGWGGFTLIELLIVMAVIGILASMALTGFRGARKGARDTQRKSDLNQYKIAIEGWSASYGGDFPPSGTSSVYYNSSGNGTGIFSTNNSTNVLVPEFLPTRIQDPLGSGNYYYRYYHWYSGGEPRYSLWALLESGDGDDWWVVCWNGQAARVDNDSPTYDCGTITQ